MLERRPPGATPATDPAHTEDQLSIRLATTVETWRPEILAFLHTGITNAGSEGTNQVKTLARDAYGFRNPGNQRLRARCATTRRARGHLDARKFR